MGSFVGQQKCEFCGHEYEFKFQHQDGKVDIPRKAIHPTIVENEPDYLIFSTDCPRCNNENKTTVKRTDFYRGFGDDNPIDYLQIFNYKIDKPLE